MRKKKLIGRSEKLNAKLKKRKRKKNLNLLSMILVPMKMNPKNRRLKMSRMTLQLFVKKDFGKMSQKSKKSLRSVILSLIVFRALTLKMY